MGNCCLCVPGGWTCLLKVFLKVNGDTELLFVLTLYIIIHMYMYVCGTCMDRYVVGCYIQYMYMYMCLYVQNGCDHVTLTTDLPGELAGLLAGGVAVHAPNPHHHTKTTHPCEWDEGDACTCTMYIMTFMHE